MLSKVIEGRWNRIRGTLQHWWGHWTNDGVMYVSGHLKQFSGSITERSARRGTSREHELGERLKERLKERLNRGA